MEQMPLLRYHADHGAEDDHDPDRDQPGHERKDHPDRSGLVVVRHDVAEEKGWIYAQISNSNWLADSDHTGAYGSARSCLERRT